MMQFSGTAIENWRSTNANFFLGRCVASRGTLRPSDLISVERTRRPTDLYFISSAGRVANILEDCHSVTYESRTLYDGHQRSIQVLLLIAAHPFNAILAVGLQWQLLHSTKGSDSTGMRLAWGTWVMLITWMARREGMLSRIVPSEMTYLIRTGRSSAFVNMPTELSSSSKTFLSVAISDRGGA